MKTFLLTVAFGATIVSGAAFAQDQGGGRGGYMQDMTRAQAQQMADGMFQRFDLNHDGVVTRGEAQQALSQAGGESSGHAEHMLARLFGESQSVTQAQAEAQALTHFDAQDLNHDGTVTAAERQQVRDQRAQTAQPPASAQPQ